MKPLDLSGKGKASDYEIESCAKEIASRLMEFDSPKDAGSAITLAHWYIIKAAFPPEYRAEARDAVTTALNLINSFIDEGWQ